MNKSRTEFFKIEKNNIKNETKSDKYCQNTDNPNNYTIQHNNLSSKTGEYEISSFDYNSIFFSRETEKIKNDIISNVSIENWNSNKNEDKLLSKDFNKCNKNDYRRIYSKRRKFTDKKLKSKTSKSILTKKTKKSSIWNRDEDIGFLAIFLIFQKFKNEIKMSCLYSLITTKNHIEFYRHYYKNKKIALEFSKVFFSYYECENINGKNIIEFTLEELFNIFKNYIVDMNFVKYLNYISDNIEVKKYFEKIYSLINFQPSYYITNIKNYKPYKEISKFHESCSPNKNNLSNKLSNKYTSSRNKEEKNISNHHIKDMRIHIEREFLERISSHSNNSNNILIDDNFVIDYIVSQFNT